MPPTTLMFLRHAEKPGADGQGVSRAGEPDPHSLSVRGWTRAGALAPLFDHVPSPDRPGLARPQRVLATKPTHEYRSKREHDTALPTAARLGLPVEDSFSHKDSAAAAEHLMGDDLDALVVWHHGSMPELLSHFPLAQPSDVPHAWPEDRFDLVWVLTRGSDGRYAFSQVAQDLLADDHPAP